MTDLHRRAGRAAEPEAPSDGQLVDAWRGGDGQALEVLVRRHQGPVYRLVLRATGDPVAAEDLTQKAFLKAVGRLGRLRRADAFRPWLYRIALNLVRNRRRNALRWRRSDEQLEHQPAREAAPDEAAARTEMADRVREAIEHLPRLQRKVVRLRLYAELPFRDIAEVLGTSEASAKVSYHHGVRALRARLS